MAVLSSATQWTVYIRIPRRWIWVDLDLGAYEQQAALAAAIEDLVTKVPALERHAQGLRASLIATVANALDDCAMFLTVGYALADTDVAVMTATGYGLAGDDERTDLATLALSLRTRPERGHRRPLEPADRGLPDR